MKKVETRFMRANKDEETLVFDSLVEENGMSEVCNNKFCYEDALFSNGFVDAFEDGSLPILGSEIKAEDWDKRHCGKEYHYAILNDECYVIFFK